MYQVLEVETENVKQDYILQALNVFLPHCDCFKL